MPKLLSELCFIVMDNSLYHSRFLHNYPKYNARKTDVQDSLKNQNIHFSPLETLAELHK